MFQHPPVASTLPVQYNNASRDFHSALKKAETIIDHNPEFTLQHKQLTMR